MNQIDEQVKELREELSRCYNSLENTLDRIDELIRELHFLVEELDENLSYT